ncbi:DUF1214 domain-containing protein [Nonomuraea ferruginea]
MFLVPNESGRYSINGDDPGLVTGADGSLDLHLCHEPPAGSESNWLPVPAGRFNLILRLYLPRLAGPRRRVRVPARDRAPARYVTLILAECPVAALVLSLPGGEASVSPFSGHQKPRSRKKGTTMRTKILRVGQVAIAAAATALAMTAPAEAHSFRVGNDWGFAEINSNHTRLNVCRVLGSWPDSDVWGTVRYSGGTLIRYDAPIYSGVCYPPTP